MTRRREIRRAPARDDLDSALSVLGAEDLREVVREMLPELDEQATCRVASSILGRAARDGSGWAPAAISDKDAAEAVAFAESARRTGRADPLDVDERLRRGAAAFLRGAHATAHRIFGALLRPIAEAEFDLGQDELADEVLGSDLHECALQYAVSAYMASDAPRRAEAVRAAIEAVRGTCFFREPIRDMERVAVEPLPELDDFLPRWRALVAEEVANERHDGWDLESKEWLREMVRRLEGPDGLARVARSTRRADDLRCWCQSLVEAGDWKAALAAFEEAAELVAAREHARGDFLDGAALAAQQLGKKDLSRWLERAWRAEPTLLRLRRWLGTARSRPALRRRAAEALESCPRNAHRQHGLLHVVRADFEPAAKLLAAAPGLGWSSTDHPGHLLFPLFETLLGGSDSSALSVTASLRALQLDEIELWLVDGEEPRLAVSEVGDLLLAAGVTRAPDSEARETVVAAMRRAAEKRVAGVTEHARRRHYGHAASLVAACAACDPSPRTIRWAAALRQQHRRYPALRAELDQRLQTT